MKSHRQTGGLLDTLETYDRHRCEQRFVLGVHLSSGHPRCVNIRCKQGQQVGTHLHGPEKSSDQVQ